MEREGYIMHIRPKAAAAVLMSLTLTGCGVISSTESLMSPPKLTEEQSGVYKALLAGVDDKVSLCYPKGGEYRSAYIIRDLNGDGSKEAVVFYKPADSADADGNVRVNVCVCDENGVWRSVYDHASAGSAVDSVSVLPLGGNDLIHVVVGYSRFASSEKQLEVYSIGADGTLNMRYTDDYAEFHVTDLTNDGHNDIVRVSLGNEKKAPGVSLVTDTGDGLSEKGRIDLDRRTAAFEKVTDGKLAENTRALFVDEMSMDGMVATELVYCVNGELRNPAEIEGSDLRNSTRRPKGYYCMDVDGDGITEIPVTEPFPGYENENGQLLMTVWNVYQNYELTEKYSGWYSRGNGWCMMFPGRWKGLVTVRIDSVSGAVIFCKANNAPIGSSPELMRIIGCSGEKAELYTAAGFQKIAERDSAEYLVHLSEDVTEKLVLTKTEVENNFMLVDE